MPPPPRHIATRVGLERIPSRVSYSHGGRRRESLLSSGTPVCRRAVLAHAPATSRITQGWADLPPAPIMDAAPRSLHTRERLQRRRSHCLEFPLRSFCSHPSHLAPHARRERIGDLRHERPTNVASRALPRACRSGAPVPQIRCDTPGEVVPCRRVHSAAHRLPRKPWRRRL